MGHQGHATGSLFDGDNACADQLPQSPFSAAPRQANCFSGTISEPDRVLTPPHKDQAIKLDQESPGCSTQPPARQLMASGVRYPGKGFAQARAPGRDRWQFPA
jgi:hypothetical protein